MTDPTLLAINNGYELAAIVLATLFGMAAIIWAGREHITYNYGRLTTEELKDAINRHKVRR